MRITDHRYNGERQRFDLAMRMIRLEARTGSIRSFTGFSEDRIRKIYGSYFKHNGDNTVKRRRGKSPTQISVFLASATCQFEATILTCVMVMCRTMKPDTNGVFSRVTDIDDVVLGQRVCEAFERYNLLYPDARFSFERALGLYKALTQMQELYLSHCELCCGSYLQDRYALNYHVCPCCEIKNYGTRQ